ncbi:MAG: TonB family protein [Candidatus Accumulibacter sp.]|jgi:protein TonB|nr:TonB family protein [Accumulibacter sp.]
MALAEARTANGDRRLWLAFAVSLLLHALLLSLHFAFPEASRKLRNQALDVVLVNARSERRPTEAQVLAQFNLDGGGTSDEDRVASTPLPLSPQERIGNELEQARQRAQALEAEQRRLLMQAVQGEKAAPPVRKEASASPGSAPEPIPAAPENPAPSGQDLASSALAMARLQAKIDRQTNEYNKRPRVKNIGTRAEEYRFAQYIDDWRIKVERIGTLNYPQAARGKLSGSLILSVRIKSDGNVERVEIDRPSGHQVLDDAARRIVRMAGPFAEFPPSIRREYDVLEITRTWTFTSSNQLQTQP